MMQNLLIPLMSQKGNKCEKCGLMKIHSFCHLREMQLCNFCHKLIVHKEGSECVKFKDTSIKIEKDDLQKDELQKDKNIPQNLGKGTEIRTRINTFCETCNKNYDTPFFVRCTDIQKWQCKVCHNECMDLKCSAVNSLNDQCHDCGYKIDYNEGHIGDEKDKKTLYYHQNDYHFKNISSDYRDSRFIYCQNCHEEHCKND